MDRSFARFVRRALETPPEKRTEIQKSAIWYAETKAKEQEQINQIFSPLYRLLDQLPPGTTFVLSTK